ncbi:hydrogenase nickel incorporation protein HypB [Desulfomicrobium orale]|uniref:Hydantoin utilization protein A n=1 Tax=Desulfomicrobium orale DSM 12838 TaxID=888061 RepID=A0A109W5E8_9BACT|nr:hydrogenase nickel incorporation protein HypB [Desulfomicrobium orale]AMD91909.1 hydantoin utilization protein A [Desulfomicrobium orale DSM 12838]
MKVDVVRDILEANDQVAAELNTDFSARGILALNLMSSPGSGKTTLLERTLTDLRDEFSMAVIEGDCQTENDARRVAATGARAVQINTNGGCHLDSDMVRDACQKLGLEGTDILVVENVGNLVCPAEFSVGEDYKVTILSVTEGDDKPEKYPFIFAESRVMILNKIDLLPYVRFDVEKASAFARALNKDMEIFPLSAATGEGMGAWYDWLRRERAGKLR